MALTFEDPAEEGAYRQAHLELQQLLVGALRGNLAVYSEVMARVDLLERMAFTQGARGFLRGVPERTEVLEPELPARAVVVEALDLASSPSVFPDVPTRPERPTVMVAGSTEDVVEMPEVIVRLREAIGELQGRGWRPGSWETLVLDLSRTTLIQAHVVDAQLLDTPMGRSVIRSAGFDETLLRVGPPPLGALGLADEVEHEGETS